MLLQLSHFFLPFIPLHPIPFPHLSSCPWMIYISSLASPFPILFLTSPCLFCTYHSCFLFLYLYLVLPFPADNPPLDLYFYESVPVLVVCLVHFWFCFFLGWVIDSSEFVVILPFIVLIIFFFLDKSL